MKNVWIVLCSSGIGGAERRALKLAIYLAEQKIYNINVLINSDLMKYFTNDTQINSAIERKNFTIKFAEDYHKKAIDYKYFFGIIKKIDTYHSLLKKMPFVYRFLLRYFSYNQVFKAINFEKTDTIHCFSTDAVRLGLIAQNNLNVRNTIVELVGNKFLERYARQIAVTKYRPVNTYFKAVSETVLYNFNNALKEQGISNLQNISEWDGPFIYVPKIKNNLRKQNIIIFASRFNEPKNPILFAKAIKAIFDNNHLTKWKVVIRGRGALEEEICTILGEYISSGRVEVGFSGELYKDFLKSKVVVSIISTGNYPSQSLFEAMSYGVVPIISRTGNSEEKYNNSNIVFCDLNFEDLRHKIFNTCNEIECNDSLFANKSQSLIKFSDELIKSSNYLKELHQIYGRE